jgi:hypothetical protein
MFARIKKNTNTHKRSVIVCHNIRFGKKVRQRTIKVFGHSTDEHQLQNWFFDAKNWIAEHAEEWEKQNQLSKARKRMNHRVTIANLEEELRINVGIEDIFGKLYREIGFQSLLSKTHQETLPRLQNLWVTGGSGSLPSW